MPLSSGSASAALASIGGVSSGSAKAAVVIADPNSPTAFARAVVSCGTRCAVAIGTEFTQGSRERVGCFVASEMAARDDLAGHVGHAVLAEASKISFDFRGILVAAHVEQRHCEPAGPTVVLGVVRHAAIPIETGLQRFRPAIGVHVSFTGGVA